MLRCEHVHRDMPAVDDVLLFNLTFDLLHGLLSVGRNIAPYSLERASHLLVTIVGRLPVIQVFTIGPSRCYPAPADVCRGWEHSLMYVAG
jgi:hypothetical protein